MRRVLFMITDGKASGAMPRRPKPCLWRPHCGEMRATVNPRNNLAHCFCCKKNLNNIDLLRQLDYDFQSAVTLLERCSPPMKPRDSQPSNLSPRPLRRPPRRARVLQISRQFGKPALSCQNPYGVNSATIGTRIRFGTPER